MAWNTITLSWQARLFSRCSIPAHAEVLFPYQVGYRYPSAQLQLKVLVQTSAPTEVNRDQAGMSTDPAVVRFSLSPKQPPTDSEARNSQSTEPCNTTDTSASRLVDRQAYANTTTRPGLSNPRTEVIDLTSSPRADTPAGSLGVVDLTQSPLPSGVKLSPDPETRLEFSRGCMLQHPRSSVGTEMAKAAEKKRIDALLILSSTEANYELVRETARMVHRCVSAFAPDAFPVEFSIDQYLNLAQEAKVYGVEDAIRWGDSFKFDTVLLERDARLFERCGGDLAAMAESRRQAALPYSFSRQRVITAFGPKGDRVSGLSSEDFTRLLRLADDGVTIPLPPRFVPISEPAPLKAKYEKVHTAIHRMIAKQIEVGSALVLPLEYVQCMPGIHLANIQHWTTNKGKPQGRGIADMSNPPNDQIRPVNGVPGEERPAVVTACEELYGPIVHPTIQDLALMVLEMVDEHGWDKVVLRKMDLKGAFNLLWFAPAVVCLLAFPLTHSLVVIYLVGLFGWTGMPFAFQLLTRALAVLVAATIQGLSRFYVDDLMGCSSVTDVEEDMRQAHDAMTSLAGDHAVADEKTEKGRTLEFVGWSVCLDSSTVSVGQRTLPRQSMHSSPSLLQVQCPCSTYRG